VIVPGGGARNGAIMGQMRRLFPEFCFLEIDSFGFSGDAKEAVAFAFFAAECVRGRCANLPAVTGASRPTSLGQICLGQKAT
jgi:anhydro-N-acetylmuramic acid kinase